MGYPKFHRISSRVLLCQPLGVSYVDYFAVIRVDLPIETDDPNDLRNSITIKEALPTVEEAMHEVNRLNELHRQRSCIYIWNKVKVISEGRGFPSSS